MDCSKVGTLIRSLRKEGNMTQKEVAQRLNVSDKTISKWERGLGCPEVSLLGSLSELFHVNIEKILHGNLDENETDGGHMNRMQFYLCKNCGNIITSTGISEISCCGRKLEASVAKPEEGEHKATITEIENDYYITLDHEMNKTHYITFVAYVMCDKVLFTKLYPEQGAEIRIPKIQQGKLYFACNQHGLWVKGSRT